MADDEHEDQDDGQDDESQVSLSTKDLRALRKASKERNDLTSQLQARDRELAFAKAKLDFDDPRLKYFIKGYDGDLTPEAIRAQAEADGFFQQQKQGTKPEDVKAQQRLAKASSGASETQAPELGDLIRQAESPDDVMKLMIQAGYPTVWNRSED